MEKTPLILLAGALAASCSWEGSARPNIVLILADDMGYSDIGCYGGEIPTPNIDGLASAGVRFTQFYNGARSCPSRASLITGLYAHETGIGKMSEDPNTLREGIITDDYGVPGYKGSLNRNCVTLAEVMKESGYHTFITGKWHLGMHGMEKWPLQRGFERFYGILAGATSYFMPTGGRGLWLDNDKQPDPQSPYYTTDAFTDYAIDFIDSVQDKNPFFLYLAYNAPHWPLQAKQEDIDKFYPLYREKGWDAVRDARVKKMVEGGIIDSRGLPSEWLSRRWEELSEPEKDEAAMRMATYAAQVHRMDANIGRLVDYLRGTGRLSNTVIMFLSDNGACAEPYPYQELGGGDVADINNPASMRFPTYGRAWAQVSNTPYRDFKRSTFEGGIRTPFILSGPCVKGREGSLCSAKATIMDIMPTMVELGNADYPETFHNGHPIHKMKGSSLLQAIQGGKDAIHEYLFWEHIGNQAVQWKQWKAVKEAGAEKEWELYDLSLIHI